MTQLIKFRNNILIRILLLVEDKKREICFLLT